jgi:hypothetical protein
MVDFAEFKKFFLFNLIGSLIICALVAVVTVLIGDFNDITRRVLMTLFMVIIHSLVSLMFIWDDEKQNTFERLSFFINVIFILIVLSFLTSLFGVWKVVDGDIVRKLYMTYLVIGFASLHGDILSKALNKENYLDGIIYSNYLFMIGVVIMLQPIIYMNNAFRSLGEVYYRILAAIAIVDGTLSILTMIFYKLYMHKNPREKSDLIQGQGKKKRGLNVWVWILIAYLIIQIFFGFGAFFLRRFF